MLDIERNFLIQWVGPFSSDEEIAKYEERGNQGEVCNSECFSFYYISGVNKIGRPKIHRYFGIHHELDGIRNRLNLRHPILGRLKDNDSMEIWIGSLAHLKNHSYENVEDIETLFIRHYRDLLTDNDKKKKTPLKKLPSMSVVNLWYDWNERPWKHKPNSACYIDDVMVWENDHNRLLSAYKLSEREE